MEPWEGERLGAMVENVLASAAARQNLHGESGNENRVNSGLAPKAKAAQNLPTLTSDSLADLVASLEESRVTDTAGDFARLSSVRQQRIEARKEVARLNAETREIARRRKRQLAKTEKHQQLTFSRLYGVVC